MLKRKKVGFAFKPVQILTIGFLMIIFFGGTLLSLPISSANGTSTPFIDAVFTATSAVCVTGLTTVNTAAHWSLFGKTLIMMLIEVGGLGFMSLTVLAFLVSRKKINMRTRMVMQEAMNADSSSGILKRVIYMVKFSLFFQFAGAVLMMFTFIPQYGVGKGIYYGIFHAVSAFCNAGFDLFGDSLVPYQQNPFILMVISALIISGGLGFIVWMDIYPFSKKRKSLHTALVLRVTAVLLIGGAIIFFLTDMNEGLKGMSFSDKLFNSIFAAVTPRTAGFYSVDYTTVSVAGIVLTMVLMFIGGSPGSTAGGLKTTTLGLMVLKIRCIFKGRKDTEFHERRVSNEVVERAFALFFLAAGLVIVSTMVLSITEKIPEGFGIEYLLFEVISAFGTVGSTLGLTPHMTVLGKILCAVLMFIGRVGTFTIFFALIKKGDKDSVKLRYPQENIMTG
ncbi:TrkH family potassium uptake protein [Isobaculum melis]|nr:TrkH family potassium uptake protein [Isobaculum melis]